MVARMALQPKVAGDRTERYLRFLGLHRAAPSYAALSALTRAQKLAVVFENITAILRREQHRSEPVPPIDHDVLLSNWEQGSGGGVCFEITDLFLRLLTSLGYKATMVLAAVRELGNHRAIVVDIEGRRYLVDVGNGMPVFEPVPLEGEFEGCHPGQRVRFHPGETVDEWHMDCFEGDAWRPLFRYDLSPLDPALRESAYQRLHDPGYSFVVSTVRIVRCTDDAVYRLTADSLTVISQSGVETTSVTDEIERERLLRDFFALPGLLICEGIEALNSLLPVV